MYSVLFADVNNGTAVGSNGTILRTEDGGITWTPQTSGTTQWVASISFTDENNGTAVGWGGTILRTTNGGVTFIEESETETPNKFMLVQNYPNPFNPSTTIQYDLPKNTNVVLKIYNMLGQEI